MAKIKCINLVQMRLFLQEIPDKETKFLNQIPPDLQDTYKTVLQNQWIPVEPLSTLYTAGAAILYPNTPEPLIQLGQDVSKKTYSGIYSFFLKIPSADYVLKRLVNLWYLFHDTGQFGYENLKESSIDLYARNYPELTLNVRKMIIGKLVSLDIIGLQSSGIDLINDDPNNWRWHINFEQKNNSI